MVVVNSTTTWREVTGLQLYSRYELSVTAFNSRGEGPRSAPRLFSTPEGGELQTGGGIGGVLCVWTCVSLMCVCF